MSHPTTPLTKDEIQAGLELCEKAHPGPYAPKFDTLIVGPHRRLPDDIELVGSGFDPASRDLFIQSRTLLPRALSDLKRLRELLERAHEMPCVNDGFDDPPCDPTCEGCTWNAERRRALGVGEK